MRYRNLSLALAVCITDSAKVVKDKCWSMWTSRYFTDEVDEIGVLLQVTLRLDCDLSFCLDPNTMDSVFTSTHNRYIVIISKNLIFWHAFSIYLANLIPFGTTFSLFSENAQTLCNYTNNTALIRSVPFLSRTGSNGICSMTF